MSTAKTTTKFDLYQTVTDKIISLLEQGTIPWRKPWSSSGPPMNAISKRPYQGINLWMLLSLSYESNLYLTWDQLKNNNGFVNRGEKAHIVVYWQAPEKEICDESEPSEKQEIVRPTLRYHKVFNIEQCSGIALSFQESTYEKQIYPVAVCEGIVQQMPNAPEIRFGKAKAFYDTVNDFINMPPMKRFNDSEAYYSTLFHEMVHSTGHVSRVGRKGVTETTGFGSPAYSFEELVAELGSSYLCSHAGISQKELKNSAAYIKSWLKQLQNNNWYIVLASSQAQKAVNYILQRGADVTLIGTAEEQRA